MNNQLYLIDLYDIYKKVLTDKQQAYFEDYYFNNLTFQEISDLYDISKTAIHKQIKETEDKLINLESLLGIYKRNNEIKDLIKDCDLKDKIEELL
jgi:uncharacterized protein